MFNSHPQAGLPSRVTARVSPILVSRASRASGSANTSAALPPPLHIANASAPAPPVSRSQTLMDRIAVGDRELCALMAQPPSPRRASDTAYALSVIEALAEPRRRLAMRTAESLAQWQDPDALPFALKPEELQLRVLHAGLTDLLRFLPLGALTHPQRLRIGEVLRETGAHPGTLRAWLGLEESDLGGHRAFVLLDLMLTLEQSRTLNRRITHSIAMSEQRATIWQQAMLVNERFGYTLAHPAWSYMTGNREPQRLTVLRYLAGQPETRRHGIDIERPW